jgi:hypothetical protein
MRVGVSTGSHVKSEPRLPPRGRVKGWRATRTELQDRHAFDRMPEDRKARIESKKLEALRETMDSIFG